MVTEAKRFWDFLEELEFSGLIYLERKVSGIFWRNLNFPASATWSEKFLGFFGGT